MNHDKIAEAIFEYAFAGGIACGILYACILGAYHLIKYIKKDKTCPKQ